MNAVACIADAIVGRARSRPTAGGRAFFGISALLFVFSTVVTIVWCGSMSSMEGMPMPGGWTMSMAWMRMPGQTQLAAAASFLGMWTVMMVAMMLPCVAPMLWRYRQAIPEVSGARRDSLTALVGAGYFTVWTALGVAVFPLGVALADAEMEMPMLARGIPLVIGVVVLIAGLLQFTPWKMRHLACCRADGECCERLPANAVTAWRHGLRLGFHCIYCCAGPTAVLLAMGVMDLRTMAVVTATIMLERLAPAGERIARMIGVVAIGAGAYLIALKFVG